MLCDTAELIYTDTCLAPDESAPVSDRVVRMSRWLLWDFRAFGWRERVLTEVRGVGVEAFE